MKFLALLGLILTFSVNANLPPTTSRKSGDSSNITTFNFQFPNFTGTRSGSTTVFQTNSVAGGGTGLGTLTANNVILGNGTSSPTFVAPGITGNVLTSNGTTWTSSAPSATSPKIAVVRELQPSGTNGGTFTAGSWQDRVINDIQSDPNSIVTSVSGNVFTLPAGSYYITWSAPAVGVDSHVAKLYNNTDAADVAFGTVELSQSGNQFASSRSVGFATVTIAGSKGFKIQHQCATTRSTNGFGVQNSFTSNIYTQVTIQKL